MIEDDAPFMSGQSANARPASTAAIPGAIIFELGHIYQGSTASEVIGIFVITFVVSAWLTWLFIEWEENFWVPVFLYVLMNLSWILFKTILKKILSGLTEII